jgi:pimeloyl-ACP methyl ester carboxylesterase
VQRWTPRLALIAGWLAAMAVANYALSRRAERRYPPRGKFITIDGVKLHYLEQGHGPPLVLLHGNGAMAEDFDISGLMLVAAEHHRVIAFDRPGFGYSERPRGRFWSAHRQARLMLDALHALGI